LVGVHTGTDQDNNFGTFFKDLLGLRELFKDNVFFFATYDKFDEFYKN
jgi:hypothetical protein